MKCLFALLCLVAAVYAARPQQTKSLNTLPTVGEIFGPAITAISIKYPCTVKKEDGQNLWTINVDGDTELKVLLSPDQIFKDVKEMKTYVKNHLTDDTVVIETDPYKLNEKYLEVLWSKAVPLHALKFICHYPSTKNPSVCKNLKYTDHALKLTYSMVRLVGDHNTVFPIVFLSHKACRKNMPCFWFSHPTEIAVLDKSII